MRQQELELLDKKRVEVVLREMAQGLHGRVGSQSRQDVEDWLRSKGVLSEVITLALAKEANELAREANNVARLEAAAAARSARWAKIAAIIAAIAAIIGPILSVWLTKN